MIWKFLANKGIILVMVLNCSLQPQYKGPFGVQDMIEKDKIRKRIKIGYDNDRIDIYPLMSLVHT